MKYYLFSYLNLISLQKDSGTKEHNQHLNFA